MNIIRTDNFVQDLKKLPLGIKNLYSKQELTFRENWLDPRLRAKRIKELPGVYSFRITRRYRVLFYFREEDAVFFTVGHRKDVYK